MPITKMNLTRFMTSNVPYSDTNTNDQTKKNTIFLTQHFSEYFTYNYFGSHKQTTQWKDNDISCFALIRFDLSVTIIHFSRTSQSSGH